MKSNRLSNYFPCAFFCVTVLFICACEEEELVSIEDTTAVEEFIDPGLTPGKFCVESATLFCASLWTCLSPEALAEEQMNGGFLSQEFCFDELHRTCHDEEMDGIQEGRRAYSESQAQLCLDEFGAAACPADGVIAAPSSCSTVVQPLVEAGDFCYSNSDCTNNGSCLEGSCGPEGACAEDGKCAAGQRCTAGICAEPSETDYQLSCLQSNECPGGLCIIFGNPPEAGVCSGSCMSDEDCSGSGRCFAFPFSSGASLVCLSPCREDSQCNNEALSCQALAEDNNFCLPAL